MSNFLNWTEADVDDRAAINMRVPVANKYVPHTICSICLEEETA